MPPGSQPPGHVPRRGGTRTGYEARSSPPAPTPVLKGAAGSVLLPDQVPLTRADGAEWRLYSRHASSARRALCPHWASRPGLPARSCAASIVPATKPAALAPSSENHAVEIVETAIVEFERQDDRQWCQNEECLHRAGEGYPADLRTVKDGAYSAQRVPGKAAAQRLSVPVRFPDTQERSEADRGWHFW
jgi:hypothetical protein